MRVTQFKSIHREYHSEGGEIDALGEPEMFYPMGIKFEIAFFITMETVLVYVLSYISSASSFNLFSLSSSSVFTQGDGFFSAFVRCNRREELKKLEILLKLETLYWSWYHYVQISANHPSEMHLTETVNVLSSRTKLHKNITLLIKKDSQADDGRKFIQRKPPRYR